MSVRDSQAATIGTPPSNSADLAAEVQALEHDLASATAPPVAVQRLQNQLAVKRIELNEIIECEQQAALEHERQQEALALREIEDDIRKADALVQALRGEMSNLQQRLTQAEFRFNECLRTRGKILRKQGKS